MIIRLSDIAISFGEGFDYDDNADARDVFRQGMPVTEPKGRLPCYRGMNDPLFPKGSRAVFAFSTIVWVTLATATQAFAQNGQSGGCPDGPWFCVDAFNEGLSAAPPAIDRATPRATIESLLFAADREAWHAAAHLLDLRELDADRQADIGSMLALQLHTVISRKLVINWDNLADRPDGLDESGSSNEAMVGEPRQSILLWTLDLADHPAAIRLNRIASENQQPVWVFSAQTVQNISALHDRYGPSEFEDLLPPALSKDAVAGFMWWEILALPIVLLGVVGASRLLWIGISRTARKSRSDHVERILKSARGPSVLGVAAGLLLLIVGSVFVFSGRISAWLDPVAWIGLIAAALWGFVNAVEVVLDRLISFDETDLTKSDESGNRALATRLAAARRALVVFVAIVGSGIFLSQTNVFQNLGVTFLGTAGAVTIVVAFAARRVLGNILASLQIALNQSARIGDRIVFNDYLCHVERINFTFVQLRDWDGTRIVVPVEEFISSHFENWSMKEPEMLRIIKLKCAHDADVDALRDAFFETIDELDRDLLGDVDTAKVRVAGQDVFGKDVWFALPCADPNTSWDVACQAREKLIARGNDIAARNGADVFPEVKPAEAA